MFTRDYITKEKNLMTSESNKKIKKIFISYSREHDLENAKQLYHLLKNANFLPWMEVFDLPPGVEWGNEIKKVISKCDHVILCLSSRAVNKIGFAQNEWRYASEKALNYPEGYGFILPIRLDNCERPFFLERYHTIDCFTIEGMMLFIEQLKSLNGEQDTEMEQLLRFKEQLNAPDLTVFIRSMYQRLNTNINDSIGCLVLCVAILKGRNLVAANADIKAIEITERFLPYALKNPTTRPTALYILAFIICDFYEKRGMVVIKSSKQIFQEIMDEKLIPDKDLIKGLVFSSRFLGYIQQVIRWIS